MTIARYSFLPWLRRGIANRLQTPAASTSRAKLSVALTVASDVESQPLAPREVQLVGPGDVIGINPQLVVRTEPRHWIADFEPNYLAFIEFYDEDFPWRYTPASPDTTAHRLTPWITLLLLKETEFQRENRPGKPLPAIKLTPAANVSALFAPAEQLWAWAHVHVNDSLGPGHVPDLDGLDARLRANPDVGYARLFCPRRLEPNTGYTAVVIPTFEVGRKAGLGQPVADGDPGLDISWTAATEFPVYYEWFFRTGAAGDFEELVRALKPRSMPKEVGIRDLDIQRPGFGLPPIASAPDDVVGLEGALLSPFTVSKPLDAASNFPPEIEKQVNLAADAADAGVGAEDPVVTAPLYGRWHALVERVSADPADRNWVNELNTDPRLRSPAGMGTRVIQQNQEEFMKLAWQQIGEILAANRKIHFVQMALKASQAAYEKHLAPLPDASRHADPGAGLPEGDGKPGHGPPSRPGEPADPFGVGRRHAKAAPAPRSPRPARLPSGDAAPRERPYWSGGSTKERSRRRRPVRFRTGPRSSASRMSSPRGSRISSGPSSSRPGRLPASSSRFWVCSSSPCPAGW